MLPTSPPVPDEDSAPYWAGLREHRLELQRCDACAEVRFPRMPACPRCGSPEWSAYEASGAGRVYSWIVVHRPLPPFEVADLPVTIATVELDEGCRMLGRLVSGEAAVDVRVSADFVDHADRTELVFRAADDRTDS